LHVLYINLDSRTDRKVQIEKELEIFSPGKVTRIPGEVDTNKRRGCAKSHLKALIHARDHNFPNVLILEDDAMWSNVDTAYPVFEKLIKNSFDVLMLSTQGLNYDNKIYKIITADLTSSYLVNSSYYNVIIDKLQELVNNPMYDTLPTYNQVINGVTYHTLQKTNNWFVVVPSLMIQRNGYSNINEFTVGSKGV